jgi:PhnB protein
MNKAKRSVPEGYHTVTPQLIFNNTEQAIDWYKKALDAKEVSRSKGPDGKVMHAEIQVGDSRLMLNDEMGGGKSAQTIGGTPVSLWVYVDDCDAMFNSAMNAGAKVFGPMGQLADQFWGDRAGTFTDPFGYRWSIATHKQDLTQAEMEQRAAEFFKQNAPQPVHH